MADVIKMATRDAYGKALVEAGKMNEDFIVLDADLAAATKTGMFKKAFPERFYDCGIAEQNMVGIAAGIAATGKKVFCSSFAMFAAGRAYEQVRNSIGYPHLNVIIGATHAGISVGEDGATHQCCEDIALMRTIPGMTIINPADETEAALAVRAAIDHDGPVYMRFGRLAVPVVFGDDYNTPDGTGQVMRLLGFYGRERAFPGIVCACKVFAVFVYTPRIIVWHRPTPLHKWFRRCFLPRRTQGLPQQSQLR